MPQRVLALDVGEKRIGVAVSDPLGLTAQGVETITCGGWSRDIARIRELCDLYQTDRLLVGLPRSLNGQLGPQADRILAFSEQLISKGFSVRYQDERLTTSQSERILIDGNVRRADRKKYIDKLAATFILQSFLDAGGWAEDAPTRLRVTDTSAWRKAHRMEQNSSMELDNVIELVDEEGNTVSFEIVMTVPYGGEDYVLLAPVEPTEDMEEDEVLVLRIDNDDNGEEIYVSVDDDDVVSKVFEKYLELVEDEEA